MEGIGRKTLNSETGWKILSVAGMIILKMDKKVGWNDLNWICVLLGMDKWRKVMNIAVNIRVP